jgi:alpha-beta hydrolase superfamily lysophospholipase
MATLDINLTPTGTLFEIDALKNSAGDAKGAGLGKTSKITGRTWGSASECHAAVLLVHGLGAHSGWFEALARRLKIRQLFVASYDLVGFGKRIQEEYLSLNQWLDDLVCVFAHLKSLVPDKPVYLLGNSMGAIVALKGCPIVRPSGLVLLSPGFEGHPETFKLDYRLKAIVKAVLSPNQEIALPYDLSLVTSQKPVRDWLDNDPEKRFCVPGRMLLDLLGISQSLRWSRATITCPALMLTAGQDRLVDNGVNRRIFHRLSSPKKTTRLFESSMHDLTLEPVIDEVADGIAQWISESQVSAVSAA